MPKGYENSGPVGSVDVTVGADSTTVTAPAFPLVRPGEEFPVTGSDTLHLLVAAFALIGLGGLSLRTRRRLRS